MAIQDTVATLLQYSLLLSIYHWHTSSYSRHKATDELYHHLVDFIDQLVEYYQGTHSRLPFHHDIHIQTINDTNVVPLLESLSSKIESIRLHDQGIRARRDDLIGYIHHAMYLFTLN
jgi:hypothetical protein